MARRWPDKRAAAEQAPAEHGAWACARARVARAVLAPFVRGTGVRHRRVLSYAQKGALCEMASLERANRDIDHTDEISRTHSIDVGHMHVDTQRNHPECETTPAGSHACPFRQRPRSPRCCTDYGERISHQVGVPVRWMELRWGSGLRTRGVHLPPSGQQLLGTHTHRTRARRRRLVSPSARTEGDLELLLGCSQPRRRLLDHCPLPPE